MRFVDEAVVSAKAGDGGNGIVSWRREKYVPQGGPAGGDGGNGGDVVLVADEGINSLLNFHFKPILEAQNGENGRSKNQYGSDGADFVARVPVGTQVFDADTDELLADLDAHGQRAIVCHGGSGGWGNTHFATSSRQAPDFAKPGLPGEEKKLRLSLKLMADVGLLGFPNAGKSTLLSVLSAARPKIADYPFTTLVPQLGVVRVDESHSFVMADIPGLIEGASEGAGLGIRFLKHLERVRVLCHLIEPIQEYFPSPLEAEGQGEGGEFLISRYLTIRAELQSFDEQLTKVPEIVVLTKADLFADDPAHEHAVSQLKEYLTARQIPFYQISAVAGVGLSELIRVLWNAVSAKKYENPTIA